MVTIPSAIQSGSDDVSGVKMLQTPLHVSIQNQGVPSTPDGNFRCISVSRERNELAAKYQRLPHIFDYGRLTGTGHDIVRCRPTTGNRNGAYKPEVVLTQERYEISARFQRILSNFRPHPTRWSYRRYCPMSADIQPTTGNSNAGL